MANETEKRISTNVVCPRCGKAFPVRLLSFTGEVTLSVKCRHCKNTSELTLKNK